MYMKTHAFRRKQTNTLAFISGPVAAWSTHMGLKVELFFVSIALPTGDVRVFHAPSAQTCRDWLIRQGYFPEP